MRDKRITPELRRRLRRPFGLLLGSRKLIDGIKRNGAPLISVGDVTTLLLLDAGIIPDVSFFDFKRQRRPIPRAKRNILEAFDAKAITISNPAGVISRELQAVCARLFSGPIKKPFKVIVKGEEDLAALAAAIYAPIGSIIAYGQPSRGAVLLKLTERRRALANEFFRKAKNA